MRPAARVRELLEQRPPTLGDGRLLCIDGPAGSGKTTLAEAVVGFDTLNRRRDRPNRVNHHGDLDGHHGGVHDAETDANDGRGVRLLHMDDLYPGWSGLPLVDEQLEGLLTPLAQGRAGRYRRYDWLAGEFAETVVVEPVPLLILEGVGSGAARFAALQTVLVWVEAPYDLRLRRGIDRDGDAFAPYWEQWADQEQTLFARESTRERADVVVDGTQPY